MFYMSRAAPLLRLTDGKWAVHPDGAALLSSITTPVCVICVAGRYRTGKSFFLNSLAGNTAQKASAGFKVGSTSESCTRGIDVCVPEPSAATLACGGTLVLLDTEGLASMDQDETYDSQVFALGLLLSSHFVLNQMGVIDESAIDQLYLVVELSKHICVTATSDGGGDGDGGGGGDDDGPRSQSQLAQFFPPLLWLLRDLVVDLTTDGKQVNEHEYMEGALADRPPAARRSHERNQVRAAVRQLFPRRSCRTLVRPAVNSGQAAPSHTALQVASTHATHRASSGGEAPCAARAALLFSLHHTPSKTLPVAKFHGVAYDGVCASAVASRSDAEHSEVAETKT